MKYIKGTQTYKLESLELCKMRLTCASNTPEGIWVRQADHEVVLQNDALAFYPFNSWGVVLPSKYCPGDKPDARESIDVTELRGNSPADTVLTLHPEAWDQYLEHKVIDAEGNFVIPEGCGCGEDCGDCGEECKCDDCSV